MLSVVGRGLDVGINNSSLCADSFSPGPTRPYYAASVPPSLAAGLTSTTVADLTSKASFHFFPRYMEFCSMILLENISPSIVHNLLTVYDDTLNMFKMSSYTLQFSTSSYNRQLTQCTETYKQGVGTKKNPEIAVIFLHSSLTARNWAINSGLTAPLSHPAPVVRTILTSAFIVPSFKRTNCSPYRSMAIGQIHDKDTCCLFFLSCNQLPLSSSGNSIRWARQEQVGASTS